MLVILMRVLSSVPFFSLSGVKSKIYRLLGAEVGEHVYFAPGAFIYVSNFKKLKIGDGVTFGHDVEIHCDELQIGDDTRFGRGVSALGTVLKVGKGCYFLPRVYIDMSEPVIIEDDVGIGADYIFTHSAWHPITEGGPRKFAPVHIKKGAWIPAGVFIMPGVTIGENATVGARSLIISDVPDGCLAVGVPAKVIKTADETRRKLSKQERDKIVRGIIDDYIRSVKKSAEIFSEDRYASEFFQIFQIESKARKNFLSRMKRWAIIYKDSPLNEQQMNSIKDLCGKFDKILFVSLVPIEAKFIESLNARDFANVTWFSIEDRMRKKSWDAKSMSLHDFFRSRYGIRFKFYKPPMSSAVTS